MSCYAGRVRAGLIATVAGVALAAAHVALVPALIAATARPPLEVRRTGGLVAEPGAATAVGEVIGGAPAVVGHDGDGPGLVWTRWIVRYRGGVERAVGAVQLVGPLQDVSAPPCSGRLIVGQRLLDDGAAGPGTVAAVIARELTAALDGTENFATGRFVRVDGVRVRWAELGDQPFDLAMFPATALRAPRPTGYLRTEATLAFERVRVPVTLGAIVRLDGGRPAVTVGVRARLDFDSRVLRWISEHVGGDRLATRMASGQLDTTLLAALGPPPPVHLPGGGELVFEPCPDRPVEVRADAYAAVPLRWRLGGPVGAEAIRPPARGPVAFAPPPADARVVLDLDLDALNGLVYELWRAGWLDRQLDQLAIHDRFNRDATVATYLTLRLSPVRLPLPPTLAPGTDGRLRLALALALNLADGPTVTAATAWGALDVGLGATAAGDRLAADVGVTNLELTCEPSPGRLVPCYGDIVAAVRAAAPDAHAGMGAALADALDQLFVDRRLTTDGAPAALAITGVRAHTDAAGAVRLELDAHVAP